MGAVAVIALVTVFVTSGLCYYYMYKKKRHTAEKGPSTIANPAYGELTVASSTHDDFESEVNPAYAITKPSTNLNVEYEEINIVP